MLPGISNAHSTGKEWSALKKFLYSLMFSHRCDGTGSWYGTRTTKSAGPGESPVRGACPRPSADRRAPFEFYFTSPPAAPRTEGRRHEARPASGSARRPGARAAAARQLKPREKIGVACRSAAVSVCSPPLHVVGGQPLCYSENPATAHG